MMAYPITTASRWSTTCCGQSDDSASGDLHALHAHLALCQRPSRSAFFLRGAASEFGAFLLTRVISTVFIAGLLLLTLLQVL